MSGRGLRHSQCGNQACPHLYLPESPADVFWGPAPGSPNPDWRGWAGSSPSLALIELLPQLQWLEMGLKFGAGEGGKHRLVR